MLSPFTDQIIYGKAHRQKLLSQRSSRSEYLDHVELVAYFDLDVTESFGGVKVLEEAMGSGVCGAK